MNNTDDRREAQLEAIAEELRALTNEIHEQNNLLRSVILNPKGSGARVMGALYGPIDVIEI